MCGLPLCALRFGRLPSSIRSPKSPDKSLEGVSKMRNRWQQLSIWKTILGHSASSSFPIRIADLSFTSWASCAMN